MVDWPTTLPGFLSGISDKRGSTRIRSSVDVGPALVRNRYTAAVRDVNVSIRLTPAQREIFDKWYETDLNNGTLRFNWVDPVNGDTVEYRFRNDDAPMWNGDGGGDVQYWLTTLELEILP